MSARPETGAIVARCQAACDQAARDLDRKRAVADRPDTCQFEIQKFERHSSVDEDLLGEAQWAFLEDELNHSEAAVHIIVSGRS